MTRNRKQLEESLRSLQYMVQRLEKEIDLIQQDISDLGAEVRLDDNFFWNQLAPLMEDVVDGRTTAQMLRSLRAMGVEVPPGNFRTFVSRCGQRGYLESSGNGRALLWKLTAKSKSELATHRRKGSP